MKLLIKFFILALVLLNSCTTTNLNPPGISPEIISLAQSNNRQLILKVTNSFNLDALGHQYVGILAPMGKIKHNFLEQTLLQKLYTELALRGYHPRIDLERQGAALQIDQLTVDLANIQLTAFDLVMTRKVVSKIKLNGEFDSLRINIPIKYSMNSSYSEFKSMPFESQLQRILDKSIDAAIQDLLNKLRL